ncbi:MAG: PQQ-binding-like beta-propeller repeat protein [Polyangiales bacterium]
MGDRLGLARAATLLRGALLAVALAGCSGSAGSAAATATDATADTATTARCLVGESRACACPSGLQGAQVCTAGGALGPCACDAPRPCDEGASVACACDDGREGAQVCVEGQRFSPCVCADTPDDAGAPDAPSEDVSVDRPEGDAAAPDASDDVRDVPVPDLPTTDRPDVATLDAPDVATVDAPDVGVSDAPPVDVEGFDVEGFDVVLCGPGERRCEGVCTDVAASRLHCGACGHPCAEGTACVGGACGAGGSAWPTLGGDNRHTGFAAGETGVPPLALAWSAAVAVSALWPVVVSDHRVFVTANYNMTLSALEALRVEDGARVWTRSFGSQVYAVGQPTVAEGAVYVAQGQTPGSGGSAPSFSSFDAATGALRWRSAIDALTYTQIYAPIVEGGAVFTQGGPNGAGLYAFETRDGARRFFRAMDQSDAWSPSSVGGALYTFVRGRFDRLNLSTGASLGTTTVLPWSGAQRTEVVPALSATRAVLTSSSNLIAVNLSTGAVEWTNPGGYSSSPALLDGVVYAIRGQTLVAHSESTGAALWTYAASESLRYPPVIAAGRLYVSGAAHVFAINLSTHALEWTGDTAGWLSIAEGRLFVARANGVLDVFSFTR